jgi:hypothetical protein
MALELFVKDVTTLPPDVAKEYVKDGDQYRLDVPGVVPSAKLAEFRDSNISLKKQLEAFGGVTPEKIKELTTLEQQVVDKKLLDAGKVDELVQGRIGSMKTEYETKLQEQANALTVTSRQLESLLIDSAIRSAATPAEGPQVLPTAIEDVLLRAKTVFRLVDGVATPIDSKGQVIYGANGTDVMSISEWMKSLHKNATHLFQGSKGGGAPTLTGRHGGDSSTMSATQKIAAGLR